MGDSGPAACTAELRLQLSAALQLQDTRRGGGPATSSGRVRRGLHCRIPKGYLLELESGLNRLNAADGANLETVRARVAFLDGGGFPARFEEVWRVSEP